MPRPQGSLQRSPLHQKNSARDARTRATMMLSSLILAAAPAVSAPAGDLLAIRARHLATGTGETLEHAVVLVEDGKIITVGEDLPIERGIPVLDLDEDAWVLPGLVNAYTRYGLGGQGFSDLRPYIQAADEVTPATRGSIMSMSKFGVTTAALYPAGRGVPGQSVVVATGPTPGGDMVLRRSAYLKALLSNDSTSKRNLRDGFKEADEWLDKEAKNREKYDKAKEKAEKEKDADKKKAELAELGEYKPLPPDMKGQAFLDLRAKKIDLLASLSKAADYLHFLDALGEEDVNWHLRLSLSTECDLFHVKDRIGEKGAMVIMEPEVTLHPATMRQRNLPAEFHRAGAKLVLIPRADSSTGMETWLRDVGVMVAAGLDRDAAIQGMTHHPAALLGVADRVGTLESGKDANMVILSGDPFEAGTKVLAVMAGGSVVFGEDEL